MAKANSEFWKSYKDPRWQKRRLEIMDRDEWKCRSCGCEDDTLNVHHAYYERDKKPWEYPDLSLVTLCEACHKRKHDIKKGISSILSRSPKSVEDEVLGYCAAAFCCFDPRMYMDIKPDSGFILGVCRFIKAETGCVDSLPDHISDYVDSCLTFGYLLELNDHAEWEDDEIDKWREEKRLEDLMYAQMAFNG